MSRYPLCFAADKFGSEELVECLQSAFAVVVQVIVADDMVVVVLGVDFMEFYQQLIQIQAGV